MNADRNTYLGGTDVAAICGVSEYRGPLEIYRRKIGEIPEIEINEAMYWGQQIEPLILAEWAKRSRGELLFQGLQAIHPLEPWRGGTADGIGRLDGRQVLLEAKKIGDKQRSKWCPFTNTIPIDYLYQIQHYLDVHGLEQAICCVLFGGSEYQEFPIAADPIIQAEIRDEANRFWHENVLAQIPPTPKKPKDLGEAFEVTEDGAIDHWLHELVDLRKQSSTIEDRLEFLETQLKEASKGRRVTYQGREIGSWSIVNRKEQVIAAKQYQMFRLKPVASLLRILGKSVETNQEES